MASSFGTRASPRRRDSARLSSCNGSSVPTIKCVRGKCPECGSGNFTYVTPGGDSVAPPVQSSVVSDEMEERQRGQGYANRSQAYLAAVTAYADLKDAARGAGMSSFMRSNLFIVMQKKTPSDIQSMCDTIRAAMAEDNKDMKAFISALEGKELYSDINELL